MAPDPKGIVELECHTHYPDAAQQMVGMGMGNKEVADVLATYSSPFKLGKDTITATCINKQNLLFTMKCKASVVASGGQSIASTKHRNEVLLVMHI